MKTIKSDEKEILHEEWGGHVLHFLCRHFWADNILKNSSYLLEGFYSKGTVKTGKHVRKMSFSRCIGCGRQRLLITEWDEKLPRKTKAHGDTGYT